MKTAVETLGPTRVKLTVEVPFVMEVRPLRSRTLPAPAAWKCRSW